MEYQGKLNEKYTLASILFQVLKVLLIKRYSYQFFCFYQLLHLQISIFYFFSTSVNTIWKKIFGTNFHFFNRFNPTLQPPYQRKFAKYDKSFFYLLFGCPPPTFGHCGGHSLTNPMLITAFSLFCLEGH